jgi:hypothetical protein
MNYWPLYGPSLLRAYTACPERYKISNQLKSNQPIIIHNFHIGINAE